MRPSFHPRTVNGPFDDSGVFISFLFEKRAVIFDLGDIYSLSARDILKISHVFVTHTHMDHFAGFDRLLRLLLGRDKNLYLYGPKGFFKNVEGKLAGYSWNLVEHYTNHFALHVTEVHQDYLLTNQYQCNKGFISSREPVKKPFDGVLFREPALSFSAVLLDHKIPCLGFSMKEQFHVNIIKQNVLDLGFEIGPWLKEFKQALFNRQAPDSEFVVKSEKGNTKFTLGDLADRIAIITPGQKITYITDIVYSDSNAAKAVELAKDSDHLFIEAAFLEKDRDTAQHKYHLTAWQAGTIAARAGVKQFTVFHFSPRYTGMEHLLRDEATEAYEKNNK
ncbi:MAG: ribonuclease Z [Desulfobacteraceae bacterium]|nr:ribonuclease Z [Desulfobacteraceae bacterium]